MVYYIKTIIEYIIYGYGLIDFFVADIIEKKTSQTHTQRDTEMKSVDKLIMYKKKNYSE